MRRWVGEFTPPSNTLSHTPWSVLLIVEAGDPIHVL